MAAGKDDLISQFERSACSAAFLQSSLLRSILSRNAACPYLLHHGLCGRTDLPSFRDVIPLVEYDDIQPFIQKIVSAADDDGEDLLPVLCCDPIHSFILSSGTSGGKPKILLATEESRAITSKRFLLSNALLNSEFPMTDGGRTLYFIYAGKVLTTKKGLRIGAASSLHLRGGNLSKSLPQWTSPMSVVLGSNVRESMYCHLLCGLIRAEEVRVISSFLAFGITEAFRMLEEVWEDICIDIQSGTLSNAHVTDESAREDVTVLLSPNLELSQKIREECEKGWSGIIERLWPNVKYIHTIVTGSMEPYVPYLRSYAGKIPLVCGDYGSSECTVGINLNPKSPPEHVSFTLVPDAAYFEFFPMEQKGGTELPVDITGVQIGEEYEVIVTTVAGLYRYRLGDVVRITGFYHESPQFAFVRRKNVVFSLNTDKTDEREFLKVNNQASEILGSGKMRLVDFTGYADHSSRPGHYAIFWELSDDVVGSAEDSILAQCCNNIDLSFNDPYQRGRRAGTIAPLRLYVVQKGTFQKVMLHSLESGVSPVQYKTPRCIKSPDLMKILQDSVVHHYISSGHKY